MAGLRSGRPACIRAAFASTRAGFQKRWRNRPRRFKANHKKNHMDLIEGIWREFLDPYDGQSSEDTPSHSVYGLSTCCPGDVTCIVPSHAPKSRSPGEVRVEDPLSSKIPDRLLKAASWGPASPEADDVDMWPVEASGPEAQGTGASEPGRHTQGRTRGSRPPPRLGSEKDKGPELILFKRKLELLLAEPEKRKRKKQYVA
uniref:Uncharacterized protein n=1 Tax=Panthera tigris altaica TaxID=74533 RepID=A0A8C9M698_PANTA